MTRLACLLLIISACGSAPKDDAKGVVDTSAPPDHPLESGKADESQQLVAENVQSPHPYSNNLDRAFAVSLANLPACAQQARLHFRVLRTETNFDFVTVEPAGAPVQSFDGTHDNT